MANHTGFAGGNECRNARRHRGLSLLEFLGCLIAVVGGLWLGALYLGVDIRGLTYKALDDAELLQAVPEGYRPQPPAGHPASFSEEELAGRLQHELVALRAEITALRETTSAESRRRDQASVSSDPNKPTAEQTLAYWNHLREIAMDEAALQAGAQSARNDANTDQVFALRARVSRFAAKTLEATPERGVDDEALALGKELAEWFHRSGGLYDQAAQLWSNRSAQQSSAHFTHRWATSERQLTNEAELLANKATAVGAALSRRYGRSFPAFGG
jgi:hypothetical protein